MSKKETSEDTLNHNLDQLAKEASRLGKNILGFAKDRLNDISRNVSAELKKASDKLEEQKKDK